MLPDIEIKHYYTKYLKDANDDIIRFQKNYETATTSKNDSRKFISDHKDFILNNIGINLKSYVTEWIIGQYNNEELLIEKVYSKLDLHKEGKERIVLLNLIKYCNLLKKCREISISIKLAEKRAALTFGKYRAYLAKFYQQGVQTCCIDGYAYKYGYGLGDLSINRWKFSDTDKIRKRIIDYKATRLAKEKLLAEGKIPYNKKMADVCKFKGIKYNGVPYIVYRTDNTFYDICINNNQYVANRNIEFEHSEYIHYKLRGKTYEQIANECKSREEILSLKLDIGSKLSIVNIKDKTNYIKYIRNVEQSKYMRGAHNCQNRQRF